MNKDIKDIKNLLNEKLSWLKDLSNENCIIHPDIDGILSMAFLQNFSNMKKVIGVYDLDAFYMKDYKFLLKSNFEKLCAIDLDVSYMGVRSIGHHMTCVNSSENALNINEFMNLSNNPKDIVDNYFFKFPLNTVILLYAIFDIEPMTDEEIALIVYADSVFQNYKLYKSNVRKWLINLEQYEILDALDNRYDNIMDIINTKIAPVTNKIKSRKEYSQCVLTTKEEMFGSIVYKYNGNPKEVIELVRDITGWSVLDLPEELYQIKAFNNTKVVLSDDPKDNNTIKKNLEKLDKFLRDNSKNVVSSSMTYKNEYKITINKPDTNIGLINDNFQFVKR